MRKTKPLTKLRHKPQVSAAFSSVSIRIHACCIVLRSGATRSTSWRVLGPPSDFAPFSAVGRAGPQIDGWLRQFDEGTNEPDLAGQGFLKLL